LPKEDKPGDGGAYHAKGFDEPVILLTDMGGGNFDQALKMRVRDERRRVGCESSVEFLKTQIGIERFAGRKYRSMQQLIFLDSLAMGFLSYLLSRSRRIRESGDDRLRYCRQPNSLWFYRVVIALRDAFNHRDRTSRAGWCRRPP
jgi:hypothetical protein